MIDFKKVVTPMDINRGKVTYKTVSGEDLLSFKVDKVVSLERETPCYMVSEHITEGSCSQKWIKNGREINSERELTNNRIILPMSQWDEEV